MHLNNRTVQNLMWCFCGVLLTGCCTKTPAKPAVPQSRDKAAGVLMSVNSVTPWNQVSDALQPNFTISGDTALASVAPATARINEQVLKAFGLSAGVGLPQSGTQTSSKNTTQGSSTGSTTTTEATSTQTTQPGSVPSAPTGVPAGADALSKPGAISEGVDMDPMLRYQAALSLYQAVKLMNQQVHSAVSNRCFTPYLVQMKVAVLPYSQYIPFDLHGRLSFFSDPDGASSGETPLHPTLSEKKAPPEPAVQSCPTSPRVVPVLVTDDIEKAIRQNARETAEQIGAALGGMFNGVGVNLAANQLDQSATSRIGQDISSRFTVARLVDNTLYVRIGAANQGSVERSLIGQTYDVALILMVPKGDKTIQIVASTQFRNSENGDTLSERPNEAKLQLADGIVQAMNRPELTTDWTAQSKAKKLEIINILLQPVSAGNYDDAAVEEALGKAELELRGTSKSLHDYLATQSHSGSLPQVPLWMKAALWTRLTELLIDNPFMTASFDLPELPAISIPPQTVVLMDNSNDATTASIQNLSGANIADAISVALKLHDGDRGRDYILPATSLTAGEHATSLTVTFPSLAKLGIANFDPDSRMSRLLVTLAPCISAECAVIEGKNKSLEFPLLYLGKGAASAGAPSFKFTSKQYALVAADGKATATVQIDDLKQADDVILSSDTVDIRGAANNQNRLLAVIDGKIKILKANMPQTLTLQLGGLSSGMMVNLTAQAEKKGKNVGEAQVLTFVAVPR